MTKAIMILLFFCSTVQAQRFRVLALAENGGHHIAYSTRAKVWLDQLARDSNFVIDYIENTDKIDVDFLAKYRLFIQLDYAPYAWKPAAASAFEAYITKGKGGWIGFHHATLLGEFDGYPMWDWFHRFMGNIRWKDYIPDFADGEVVVEDNKHPVMQGIPDSFLVRKEEWYSYDRSPRPDVHVLAHVNTILQGDHPVIWTNPRVKARNVYIFMGHSPALFDNPTYVLLFRNAISWAAGVGK
ncbi:ThuA domain-containing protein [Chitinophaga sp.]|uniref:ThuA domain-containing protein n=1 Tax=Chitinophaga sp. TaxID=1869181 RepID=UPI0031DC541C